MEPEQLGRSLDGQKPKPVIRSPAERRAPGPGKRAIPGFATLVMSITLGLLCLMDAGGIFGNGGYRGATIFYMYYGVLGLFTVLVLLLMNVGVAIFNIARATGKGQLLGAAMNIGVGLIPVVATAMEMGRYWQEARPISIIHLVFILLAVIHVLVALGIVATAPPAEPVRRARQRPVPRAKVEDPG